MMFRRVREEVVAQTDRAQIPWEHSSLMGDFRFASEAVRGRPETDPPGYPETPDTDDTAAWALAEESLQFTLADTRLMQPNWATIPWSKMG